MNVIHINFYQSLLVRDHQAVKLLLQREPNITKIFHCLYSNTQLHVISAFVKFIITPLSQTKFQFSEPRYVTSVIIKEHEIDFSLKYI